MTRILGFVSFALFASSAIGITLYGVTFTGEVQKLSGKGVEERVSLEDEQISAIAGKANKQEVKIVAMSSTARNAMEPWPPAGAAEKEEVKAIAAPSIERWVPAGAADKEEVESVAASHVVDEELDKPPVADAPEQAKPISVSRAKKKVTSKQKIAKKRNQEKVKISVPLVLVPPAKVVQSQEDTNKKIKPVSQAPGKIIQNFGPPVSNEHFRRK